MMYMAFVFILLLDSSQAAGNLPSGINVETSQDCAMVEGLCLRKDALVASCYEEKIGNCSVKGRGSPGFIFRRVKTNTEAVETPTLLHQVNIPSSALQRSKGAVSQDMVVLVVTLLNSTYFKLSQRQGRSRMFPPQPQHLPGIVLDSTVLVVHAGRVSVQNLSQPIRLTFEHNKKGQNGTCVFWIETNDGEGHWSTSGCSTNDTGSQFICSCNHMSFFAVLVNPAISVSKRDAVNLSYITYVGSSLSVIFAIITLIIYACLHKRRPEKATGIHMNLTASLLFLHLSFLLCSFWVWEDDDGWLCRTFGLILHWSLMSTITWSALEGFHLYLLLVRVFNIYVRRYLLKLSLVGWGFSTLIAMVCGIFGVYGKYDIPFNDSNNQSSTKMCLINSQIPHSSLVIYITAMVFPCLVILCNSCMLGVVVYKMWGHGRSPGSWKEGSKENWRSLLKSCATVLGLSCVVGLPWGLITTTFISLSGIYIFTILNSLQGLFLFLWCMAMTFKSSADNDSSTRLPSSQKMMTTSFNN